MTDIFAGTAWRGTLRALSPAGPFLQRLSTEFMTGMKSGAQR